MAPMAGPNDPRKFVGNLKGSSPLFERIINSQRVQEYKKVKIIKDAVGLD
jgi:hypothetical protein